MAKSDFDELRTESWLISCVIYSYISLLISINILIEVPFFGIFMVLLAITLLFIGLIKGHGKYKVAIIISLVLNGLLLSVSFVIWMMNNMILNSIQ